MLALNEKPFEQVNLAHNNRFRAERRKLIERLYQSVADAGNRVSVPDEGSAWSLSSTAAPAFPSLTPNCDHEYSGCRTRNPTIPGRRREPGGGSPSGWEFCPNGKCRWSGNAPLVNPPDRPWPQGVASSTIPPARDRMAGMQPPMGPGCDNVSHAATPLLLPARLHPLLQPARLCVSHRRRPPPGSTVSRHESEAIRAPVCLSDAPPATVPEATRPPVSFPARGRLLDSSRQAHAMPAVSLLARTRWIASRLDADGAPLPRHWPRSTDPDWNSP